jgi:hypothetical protein
MNSNDFERDHKTKAFRVEKKQRRNDSIAWIIASIVLLFLNVVSIGRITVVGQFIDDVIFTFTFGWFKYFVYLIFIGINICIYFGIRFKFKKRFLLMVFGTWCVLAWIITAVLFIVAYHLQLKRILVTEKSIRSSGHMHRNHEFFVIHILTFHFEQGADLLVPFYQPFSHTQPFMEILVSHWI